MAPTTKWTSKAYNGRTFRGKTRDTEENALRRQFKKPRRSVEEVQVDTAQVVIEEAEDSVLEEAEDSVLEVAEDSDCSGDNIPFSELKEKIVA